MAERGNCILQSVATHSAESALPPRAFCSSHTLKLLGFFSQADALVGRTGKGILFYSTCPAFGSWQHQEVLCGAQAGWVSIGSLNERKGKGTRAAQILKLGTQHLEHALSLCCATALLLCALELVFFNIICFFICFFVWLGFFKRLN